ncbi:MAG: hypothetical protein GEV06_18365 [Luteitalea sp.]|nr:hypothetical protein [Luteitalea sp.]
MHFFCRFLIVLIASSVVVAIPASAAAQIQLPEQRDVYGIYGGYPRPRGERLRQELDLTVGLLGGYDDTVRPQGTVAPPVDVRLQQSGYNGAANAALRYWRGRSDNWFSLQGRGYVNGYSALDIGASTGGEFSGQVHRTLGRRGALDLSQSVSSDPFFTFSSFSPLEPIVGPGGTPDSNSPERGLFERRSWMTNSSVRLGTRLGRRDSANVSYNFSRRQFAGDDRGDNQAHRAGASYHRNFGRRHGFRASYQFSDRQFFDYDARERPATTHTIEGGPEFQKRLSPSRSMFFSFGLGGIHVETLSRGEEQQPLTYWKPFGQAAFRIDIARSWTLGTNYRRGVTLLEGVTSETYFTDTANVTLNGYLTRRVDVGFAGGFSQGRPRRGDDGEVDQLRTYSASAQVRVALTRHAAIFSQYSYYRYQFTDPSSPAPGFPPTFDRNAVRVGVSLWVPLAGRSRGIRQ